MLLKIKKRSVLSLLQSNVCVVGKMLPEVLKKKIPRKQRRIKEKYVLYKVKI
jgi:hypothetical protein